MITKSDWEAVVELMNAEDRGRLGEPPTVDEMFAYTRGELPAAEAARVRELLVCYPELARALAEPLELEEESSSGEGVLSEDEIGRQWAAFQNANLRKRSGRLLPFRRAFAPSFGAVAAALAIVFGVLFWHARSELMQPRAMSQQLLLLPDGRRGGDDVPATLSPEGDSFLLVSPLINQPYFGNYRLEIVDVNANPLRTLWRSRAIHRDSNDAFAIAVPRRFLGPGRYQVVLYGVEGGRQDRLAVYTLRVAR